MKNRIEASAPRNQLGAAGMATLTMLTMLAVLTMLVGACGTDRPAIAADVASDDTTNASDDATANDAAESDVAMSDVLANQDTAVADVATTESSGSDSGTADVVECCPLDPPSCDCPRMGGRRAPNGTCSSLCDAVPLGWVKGEDKYGCPIWVSTNSKSCLSGKDAEAPDTAAFDTGTPDASPPDASTLDASSKDAAAPDNGATGDVGTKPSAVECANNPPIFPVFDASCKVAADCVVLLHQVDCCGSFVAAGVNQTDLAAYQTAEKTCEAQFPKCKCMTQPTKADDGKTAAKLVDFGVDCLAGVCKTLVK